MTVSQDIESGLRITRVLLNNASHDGYTGPPPTYCPFRQNFIEKELVEMKAFRAALPVEQCLVAFVDDELLIRSK